MRLFERILYRIYCSMGSNKYTGPIKRFVAKLACPHNADEHFWHDGCVECSFDEYPYNVEFGDGRTKEEMDKMHNELHGNICPGCNGTFSYRLENYGGCCSRECMEYMIYTYG